MTAIIPAEILKYLIELAHWTYEAYSFSLQVILLSCIGNADLATGTCRLLKMSDKGTEKKMDASR